MKFLKIKNEKKAEDFIWFGVIAFLIIILFFFRYTATVEIVFIFVVGYIWQSKKVKFYFKDWLPFILVWLAYDAFRGIADNISLSPIHIVDLIDMDRALFGFVPTVRLQQYFHDHFLSGFINYMAVIFYSTHFYFPFFAGLYIWRKNRQIFRDFMCGFMILNILAFLTYLFYPAAPPWMASAFGYLPEIKKIVSEVVGMHAIKLAYSFIKPNMVAAVPSLHAAWPIYICLFLSYHYRRKFIYFLFIIPTGLWFSLVYLGEHYVFDVLLGITYALVVFLVVVKFGKDKLEQHV